jgi:hypothetical protein
MAPKDRIHLPLRWEFVPVKASQEVVWKWRAYSQAGKLEMESAQTFETLTECMDDAKLHGYEPR